MNKGGSTLKNNHPFQDELKRLTALCEENSRIDELLYTLYDVKRGLRDIDGKGVLTGLTNISTILQNKNVEGQVVPCDGELYYRGYNVMDLVKGYAAEDRFGYEETAYLLLFGKLPTKDELASFQNIISSNRVLPRNFTRDVIMKAPSGDIMNTITRCILTLYSYDKNPTDTSVSNVLRQCLELIAIMPQLCVYAYQAHRHRNLGQALFIAPPKKELSTAENILYMLRPDHGYSELEAKVLDLALTLHAEHGGGNNSTFTMHVVTSSGTDTYSAVAAALCSLKGPKHGGANLKVVEMFADLKKHVKNWNDDEQISDYLTKLLNKEAFDKSGLIYGVGHAVYTLSDPRSIMMKQYTKRLSNELHFENEFALYEKVEELAPKVIGKKRKIYKNLSTNVDFYSGFAYRMLGLPLELYTPLFATARIAGWSAHRLEELICGNKIIRPAYMSVAPAREYIPLEKR